jgi:dihydrofolate synthase/folylpolyglutamate synthase
MGYDELLTRLFSARAAGVKLGLERVRACLDALGRPANRIGVRVQVAGTNGKGSTCAFVESIAREHGSRTGVFSSPHLSRYAERFRVDGTPATDAAIVDAAGAVSDAGGDALTFFEQSTVIAVELFARAGVEIGIFEVGLGGRLDATTAIEHHIAAVTGVAIDHESYLGSTLEEIAPEKGAIFRADQRAVIGIGGEMDALPVLMAHAERARVAHLEVPDSWPLGLAGRHQRANAACAVAIATQLDAIGALSVDEAMLRRGLAEASLAGRFETVANEPDVIVDCAHNPAGASALAEELATLELRPRVIVVAVSAGKDLVGICAALAPVADAVIATQYGRERAMPAADVASAMSGARADLPVYTALEASDALDRARDIAGSAGVVAVAGSVFLAGEARELLCGVRPDPVAVTDPV